MKQGQKPITDDELKQKLVTERESKYDEAKKKFDEAQKEKEESVKNIIETALKTKKTGEEELEREIKKHQFKHYLALSSFIVIWLAFIIYTNFNFSK